jgi:PIN domain nuclease of toxin-antitoxin system
MNALLDTHVLLWWMADDARLSKGARDLIADPGVRLLWSAASSWELAIKASLGKVKLPAPVDDYVGRRLAQQHIDVLPITHAHAAAVELLPPHHRDPFDRILIAQAIQEGLVLVTGDPHVRSYQVEVAW